MMGLVYLGNGGPSSSSSNLSPLAPPFTVDRSNLKSNSNPITNFSESPPPPYGVPFCSSLHNWQYSHSSASRPDFGSSFHSEIDSICTTSLPSANNYHYLGSESIDAPSTQRAPPNPTLSNSTNPFSCAPKHYYPPYASQVVADDTLLVGLNESNYDLLSTSGLVPTVGSSQADYTQGLSGLEFPSPWGGFWNGLAEQKQGRRTEIDGIFCLEERTDVGSLVFKDYTKQGAVPVECLRKCEENPAMSHRKYDVLGRENLAGSLSEGQLNDNFFAQSLGFIPSESSKAPILGSCTISTESHLESPSMEPATFSCNRQNSCSPYEKRFQLFESCTNDCISVIKSSPTVTIRPPAFGAKSSASDTISSKSVDIGNVAAANSKDVSSHNQSLKKVPHLAPSSEGKEGCSDANPLSFDIGRNDQHVFAEASSTMEDQSNKLLLRNALDHPSKARFGALVPGLNVSHGFSLAAESTEAFKHNSISSESLDHLNPAEDSPCWKGAPASHVSPFETLQAMPLQHLMKKSEACVGLNFQGTQNFPPYNDSVTPFSHEICETSLQKESLCTDSSTSLHPKRSFNANSPAKEHIAGDAARAKYDAVELNRNDGLQILDNVDNPYDLLTGLKSDSVSLHFHTKQQSPEEVKITSKSKPDLKTGFVDVGFSTSDTLDNGCVPLHAVENVLCSPSSVEDAVKLHGIESSPKMNVQMLVNAMHNLSELLLFQFSNDTCALKEQDCKTLEHAMKNIDVYLSKKVAQSTPTQESMFPREEDSSQLVEEVLNLDSGASLLRFQAMNEVGTASHGQIDSHCINEQKREYDISGKKFGKNLDFVSSRDDADVTRHHNMVQDIRKVLDENFQLEEEIPSEAMLYKNLWLDAEAELCCIGFRARFDRVKNQMENCVSEKLNENLMAVEKLDSSIETPDLNITKMSIPETNDSSRQKTSVQYTCISSPTSHVDDVEASVMTRFHILKCRGDNSDAINVEENQLPEVVEVGFSRKRKEWQNIGNQSQNKSFDVAVGSRLQHHIGHNNEDKAGSDLDDPRNETMNEVLLSRVTVDRIIQPYRNNSLQNQLASGSGCFDSSSSDWEHVLKDDFA